MHLDLLSYNLNHKDAIIHYAKAIEIKNAVEHMTSGSSNINEAMIDLYDRALANAPNDVVVLANKGIALNNLQRYNEAIETFDKGLQVDPNHVGCLYNKGKALDMLGMADEARQLMDRANILNQEYGGDSIDKGPTMSPLPSPI